MMYRQTKDVNWLKTPEGTIYVNTGDNWINTRKDYDKQETPFGVDLDLLDDEDLSLFYKLSEREVYAQELIDNLEKKKDVSRWRAMSLRFILYKIVDTKRYKHLQHEVQLQIDFARDSL